MASKTFTFADVCKHNKPNDCWIIISGKVYDVTAFLQDHPGGDDELLKATGKDATNDFDDISHSDEAIKLMDKFYVGKIDESTISTKPNAQVKRSNVQSSTDKIAIQSTVEKISIPSTTVKLNNSNQNPQFITKILQFVAPLVILGLVYTIRAYTKETSA